MLECNITGLEAVTEYNVGALACLEDDRGCGKAVETTVTTPPKRELRICRTGCWSHILTPPKIRLAQLRIMFYFKIFFLFQAPTEFEVTPISENTLMVNMTADEGTPENAYFIAQVKANDGPSCQANASAESLECELAGLADATKCVVAVRACIALTSRMEVCSQEVTAEGYTLPNRESLAHFKQ